MEKINNESTPLVVHSSQLKVALLNINRSLTPYLFISYIDELEQANKAIESSISKYHNELEWFIQHADVNSELNQYVDAIASSSKWVTEHFNDVTTTHAQFIDINEQSLYAQSDAAMLLLQVSNELQAQLSRSGTDKTVIEQLLSQVGLIESQSKVIFSLKDPLELKPEAKNFKRREQVYIELLQKVQKNNPEMYSNLKGGLDAVQSLVFSETGSVILYLQSIGLNNRTHTLRLELEAELDNQLQDIETMAIFATDNANSLFEISKRQLKQSTLYIIIAVLTAISLACVIGWVVARSIKVPSRQINGALDDVANKNLAVRVRYQAHNELGQVARKVNLMIEQLSTVINQLSMSSNNLNEASTENQTTSDSLSFAIEEQTAQILQVASAMEEIEHAVVEIANASNDSFNLVTNAVACSDKGKALMDVNVQLIEQLSSQLASSTESIQQLAMESASIGSILDVISNISEQTNLLALNAAIEAARAGEQGRGFAVVADEVRVLASKTTSSTVEIKQKIDSLKQSAEVTVFKIASCSDYMNEYSGHADGVNLALSEVHQFLGKIEESSHQIAAATNQHKLAATEVTTNVAHIHGLAQDTTQSAHSLVLLSEKLEKMAEKQSDLTKSFHL
ncbi:methyl-accepting chemotaxis protein [Vibrio sp. DW001]|uniref:methyl-accepting chemotaxis protein n=1 Tax=Vibrio sp. DW001 TaxID=2912315 RepID=UPI0023B016B4|nr:methyl-accepting chemotaxis protein [Vibrio sp. DW001]WED27812.1 methyl-accepting chemotaxis protein [Vibrio sp. DW001]